MPSSKSKSREPFTKLQRCILFAFYDQDPYPSTCERLLLAQLTGRTIKQVQDWFANRRRTDPRLCLTTTTTTTTNNNRFSVPLHPTMTIPSIYPSSRCSICRCFSHLQASAMDNHGYYCPEPVYYHPMIYNSSLDNYQS